MLLLIAHTRVHESSDWCSWEPKLMLHRTIRFIWEKMRLYVVRLMLLRTIKLMGLRAHTSLLGTQAGVSEQPVRAEADPRGILLDPPLCESTDRFTLELRQSSYWHARKISCMTVDRQTDTVQREQLNSADRMDKSFPVSVVILICIFSSRPRASSGICDNRSSVSVADVHSTPDLSWPLSWQRGSSHSST